VPFLLATQLESYMQFLQAEVAPSQRQARGPAGGVLSISPDLQPQRHGALEFGGFNLGDRRSTSRVPSITGADLRLAAARQGAAGDHGPRGVEADGQGSQGTHDGSYMARSRS